MNPILISLPLSILAAGLIIFGDNPSHELRAIAGATKDRSRAKFRLAELGRQTQSDYEAFRYVQLLYSGSITLIFLAVSLLGNTSIPATALFCAVGGVATYLYMDRKLTTEVKKQRTLIEAEFPAIIEMLTLAISAGESPLTALKRVAENSHGNLSRRFRQVISQVHQGVSFHSALDLMSRELNSPLVRRFIDSLVNAMVRGAPITEVLTRHAQEAREHQRNRILSAAGKAEISMMIPVVFLILPISILFALWPSLTNLNLFAS
jgi:tight adherence protein C